jgi:hypothetical protein
VVTNVHQFHMSVRSKDYWSINHWHVRCDIEMWEYIYIVSNLNGSINSSVFV